MRSGAIRRFGNGKGFDSLAFSTAPLDEMRGNCSGLFVIQICPTCHKFDDFRVFTLSNHRRADLESMLVSKRVLMRPELLRCVFILSLIRWCCRFGQGSQPQKLRGHCARRDIQWDMVIASSHRLRNMRFPCIPEDSSYVHGGGENAFSLQGQNKGCLRRSQSLYDCTMQRVARRIGWRMGSI